MGAEVRSLKKTWRLENDGKTLHITAVMTEDDETNTLVKHFVQIWPPPP